MQEIVLNKPHSFSHKIAFPSEWNELSTEEMELVARGQVSVAGDEHIAKAIVFASLLEHRAQKQNIQLPADWKEKLNYEDAATQGFDAIAFLYTKNERTINPYRFIKIGEQRMIGPADDFREITCGEMEDCESFFHHIAATPELEDFAMIAAILWRPRNKPYNSKASEARLKNFLKLPIEQLFSIYIWYTGCRNRLPLLFPLVYAGGGSGEPDPASFTKCIHAGAGVKNGTRPEIRIMPAKEFLFDMQQEAEHAEKMKEEYAK